MLCSSHVCEFGPTPVVLVTRMIGRVLVCVLCWVDSYSYCLLIDTCPTIFDRELRNWQEQWKKGLERKREDGTYYTTGKSTCGQERFG